ncbi:MAG: MFS transporter [Hyphomicrobiales bacterium]
MHTATAPSGPLARLLGAPAAPSKWMTMLAVCVGLGMLMIDTFVVNVAFPAIGEDLDASLGLAEWTVSGYVLALGVLPLAMGRLGDLFGRRRVYLLGLIVFITSSGACGLAPNIESLIAFRVVQGAGAAVMMPGTLSIITAAFPPEQRGLAIGAWGGVSGLGLIAGPILGGVLVETGDWRWIFLVNLPLGVVALALGLRFVAETRDESAPPQVDWIGVGLLAAGLGAITFGLTRANEQGWTSPWMLACFIAGPALVVAFVLFEARARYPLVDLSLFRSGTFVMACVSAFLFSAAVFGSQPFTSLFMQNYMGMSPIEGGLAFIPATVLVAVLMPVSGIMGQRLGSQLRLIVIAGSLLVGVSYIALLWVDTDARYVEDLLPAFVLRGLGIGLFMSATSLATMSAVPLARAGLASGTLTMFRQLGTALGVAVLGAIFLHHIDATVPGQLEAQGVPAEQAARFEAAAEHFVAAGDGEAHETVRAEIVDGYVLLAVYGIAISALAAAAAFFIRHSAPAARAQAPSRRAAAEPALAPGPAAPSSPMNPDYQSPGGP